MTLSASGVRIRRHDISVLRITAAAEEPQPFAAESGSTLPVSRVGFHAAHGLEQLGLFWCDRNGRPDQTKCDYMADKLANMAGNMPSSTSNRRPQAKGFSYHKNSRLKMDEYGRLSAVPNRFPSSAGGA